VTGEPAVNRGNGNLKMEDLEIEESLETPLAISGPSSDSDAKREEKNLDSENWNEEERLKKEEALPEGFLIEDSEQGEGDFQEDDSVETFYIEDSLIEQ